jgi:hypothetical protein
MEILDIIECMLGHVLGLFVFAGLIGVWMKVHDWWYK